MTEQSPDGLVVRRSGQGWQVGPEETDDLTSAMVLADLLAAELGSPGAAAGEPTPRPRAAADSQQDEAARLAVTVAQLEHALTARVRVEQAIGVLAERHCVPPRRAFDLLRAVARAGGQRITELAGTVVDSASNPLLPLPADLARKPAQARTRGPSPRRVRAAG